MLVLKNGVDFYIRLAHLELSLITIKRLRGNGNMRDLRAKCQSTIAGHEFEMHWARDGRDCIWTLFVSISGSLCHG